MSQAVELLNQLQANVEQRTDELKTLAEAALKEGKDAGALSAQTAAKVDQLMAERNTDRQKLNALQVQLGEAEKAYAALPGSGAAPAAKSLGQRFIEADGVKAALASMASGMTKTVSAPIQAAITSEAASAGSLIDPHRVGLVAPQVQRLTIRDLLPWGRTDSNSLEYVREKVFTNAAATVAENTLKPESNLTFEPDAAPVVTIAHWVLATKQVLADAKMLASYINARLIYGLKLAEEKELLSGSGVGLNIKGLLTQAQAYANPGATVANETALDRLRLAMLQVELADVSPDGVVLNPIDWTTIELLKDTSNKYLMADPFGQMVPRLWSLPVVATKAMTQDNFLVGGFREGAQGWDREDANIQVSTEDGDNFRKNMVTIRCEERVGLTVYRPQAFVKGTFS